MVGTGYTDGEGFALIAPMIGAKPDEIVAFIAVAVDVEQRLAFGASSNIDAPQVPCILRALADAVEQSLAEGSCQG
jgi:hypothetical protein